jgi:hypothetical protein
MASPATMAVIASASASRMAFITSVGPPVALRAVAVFAKPLRPATFKKC